MIRRRVTECSEARLREAYSIDANGSLLTALDPYHVLIMDIWR